MLTLLQLGHRFNPRARVGRDTCASSRQTPACGFNPRARVGRDKKCPRLKMAGSSFNPRARVGRD